MKISRFDRVTDTTVQHIDLGSWEDLVAYVGPHSFNYAKKSDVPLICPAEFLPKTTRAARNVMKVHFGAVDIDGISDEQLGQLLEQIDGLRYLFYTTWSHHLKPHCARVFFPLTRAVEAREWKDFWPRLRALFLNLIDEKASDASRIFYYPSAPAGTEEFAVWEEAPGDPLDVDQLLSQTVPVVEDRERQPLERRKFYLWVQRMRPKSEYGEWLQEKLTLLMEGKAVAEEGERDNVLFKIVSACVRQFPTATTESLAELFVETCVAMGFDHKIVFDKIERAQSLIDQEQTARSTQAKREALERLEQTGRDAPYSSDEVAAFLKDADTDNFSKRWVIQKDKVFYFFCNGEYKGPFTAAEAPTVAPVMLAAASTAGVECFVATKSGWRAKTGFELAQEYGQVAYKIRLDLTAQKSTFVKNTLIEAPCPMRTDIKPRADERVETWLKLLCGTMHPLVLDWLAVSTRLDRPCSAIYLEGPAGAGKTLFAAGVAAIWNMEGNPTSLDDAFADYHEMTLGCPIVFADEHMPTDFRGQVKTGQLRQFIQGRSRTLKRKFIPDARMIGSIRLILAANHRDMIQTTEQLTLHDIQAIVERILHVPIRGECKEECEASLYLHALAEQRKKIEPDDIAQHIMHLVETREVDDSHRFLVTGPQTVLHRRLTTGSGLRSAICHWLCSYLMEPNKMDATRSLLVQRRGGRLLATSRGLTRFWAHYETNVKPPAIGPVSRALAGLSTNKRLLTAGDNKRTWYWELDPENLIAWAEDNNFADREAIEEALNARPVSRRKALN